MFAFIGSLVINQVDTWKQIALYSVTGRKESRYLDSPKIHVEAWRLLCLCAAQTDIIKKERTACEEACYHRSHWNKGFDRKQHIRRGSRGSRRTLKVPIWGERWDFSSKKAESGGKWWHPSCLHAEEPDDSRAESFIRADVCVCCMEIIKCLQKLSASTKKQKLLVPVNSRIVKASMDQTWKEWMFSCGTVCVAARQKLGATFIFLADKALTGRSCLNVTAAARQFIDAKGEVEALLEIRHVNTLSLCIVL